VRSWRWWGAVAVEPYRGTSHLTYFKMRGKNAFGRDCRAGVRGDKEHYA
jgi:hypothetical protein